ncbi:tyrosine-type recombinase/integrase, partial [Escherichia coli]
CGFALAERGNDTRLIQDYLGHRNIRHTVRYTATSPSRFRQAWSSPPRHTLIPEKTRPETSVTQTYHPPHGEDTATGLSPPDLSL